MPCLAISLSLFFRRQHLIQRSTRHYAGRPLDSFRREREDYLKIADNPCALLLNLPAWFSEGGWIIKSRKWDVQRTQQLFC